MHPFRRLIARLCAPEQDRHAHADGEIAEVDAYVRANTLERFGPVRTVKPGLVFELAFEGIQRSSRHRSGIAVRFPRISRWRRDKKIEEADRLEQIVRLLPAEGV